MQSSRRFLPGCGLALAVAFLLAPPAVHADEDLFAYVQDTQITPVGEWEITQWSTLRAGKATGTYRALDLRTELETGLSDRLQGALYLDLIGHRLHDVPGLEDRSSFEWRGASAELEYRWREPSRHGYGLALYFEPSYSRVVGVSGEGEREMELETKLIVERELLDGRMSWSLNYTLEPEWAFGPSINGREPATEAEARRELGEELATGVSFHVAPRWWVGGELRARSTWPDFSHREGTTLFLGPSLHYAGGEWWWTLAVAPQIWGSPAGSVPGLNLSDHERLEVRLKLGLEL